MAQLTRKYDHISNCEGMVIDRADWNAIYNFDGDDGASFVQNRTARSMQYSYQKTTKALRKMMDTRQRAMRVNSSLLLTNNQGFASLALMEHMDGSFSEGAALNSHGLLGMRSSAILWTYSKAECCSSEATADVFFQRQLYMKVFSMAPLPQADHAISLSDPEVVYEYSRYGGLFTTLRGAKWLLKPHAVNASGAALVNVFEQPIAPGKRRCGPWCSAATRAKQSSPWRTCRPTFARLRYSTRGTFQCRTFRRRRRCRARLRRRCSSSRAQSLRARSCSRRSA